jgi:hypothetical protein
MQSPNKHSESEMGSLSAEEAAERPSGLFQNSIQYLSGQDCGALGAPNLHFPYVDPGFPSNDGLFIDSPSQRRH